MVSNKAKTTYKELLFYLTSSREKLNNATHDEQMIIIEEIFTRIKECAYLFFEKDRPSYLYKTLLEILLECEKIINPVYYKTNSKDYIIEDFLGVCSIETLLDYIVTNVRKKIIRLYTDDNNASIDEIDMTSLCYMTSLYVRRECEVFGLKCRIVKIGSGFIDYKNINSKKAIHYFNIVEIQGKEYLVDLSYSQFFKSNSINVLSRLGIPCLQLCNPGVYMIDDNQRKNTADELLSRGWVPYSDNNIKNYFDGFTLSMRNGLYYELLGKVNYTTEYTSNDYIHFLEEVDMLYKHEPLEGLGIQKRPLKNHYLVFNKK